LFSANIGFRAENQPRHPWFGFLEIQGLQAHERIQRHVKNQASTGWKTCQQKTWEKIASVHRPRGFIPSAVEEKRVGIEKAATLSAAQFHIIYAFVRQLRMLA
jgi:hypothetical protein